MTPAERTQLAAALGGAEALERQAEALRHFAAGLRHSIEGLLMGAARESGGASGEGLSGERPAVRKEYLGGQQLLEGSSKLSRRAPRPATGERSHADPGANAQPPQE